MEFCGDLPTLDAGVGATAEARLAPLGPLIEYYEREMGTLPGRLMIATSFLRDAQLLVPWAAQPAELREAVEQAEALVVSVMIRLLNAQADAGDRELGSLESAGPAPAPNGWEEPQG
jgi:hypothetical protein